MVVIRDIRSRTKRSNGTRKLSQIKHIARHHSATTDGDFDTFWRTWNGVKGWGTGGYHEIILRDGSVQLCYDPEEITNGVANHNTGTYHISVVGNGSFTAKQEEAFKERCLYNMKRLNIPVERVLGHNEFKGANTACPGISMSKVRLSLKNGKAVAASKPVARDYLILGDVNADVKALQTYLNKVGIKVAVDSIYGEGTKQAVKDFQRDRKLSPVDGIYGKGSKAEMNKALKELDKPKEVVKPKPAATKPKEPVKAAKPSVKEEEKLNLKEWQREEIAKNFQTAFDRGVFNSKEHIEAIKDGSMTQSELLYLNNVIATAALIGGERAHI